MKTFVWIDRHNCYPLYAMKSVCIARMTAVRELLLYWHHFQSKVVLIIVLRQESPLVLKKDFRDITV
jgi:hypothetical protein